MSVVQALNFLVMTGTALLAARLYRSGLFRRYRAFFLFLGVEVMRDIAFAPLDSHGAAYQKIWVLTEPLDWLFYVLVVLEIYALVLEEYRGLSTVGRWSLIAAVGIALVAAGATALAPAHASSQSLLMSYYYQAERAVNFSLVVFLLTILALLLRYPIVLNRNIVAHSLIFSIYFLSATVIYHLLSLHGIGMIHWAGYAIDAVNLGALGAWLMLLSQTGEERKQQLRPWWMPGREEVLVNQLNSLNAAILRIQPTIALY